MIKGCHKSLSYEFMSAGHTRSFVDGWFGLIKMKYRRQDNYTLGHLVNSVSAASCSKAIVYSDWQWYEWDEFLKDYLKPIPNFTKVSTIKFLLDGICETDCGRFNILKSEPPQRMPATVRAGGLSVDRSKYLREQVSPLVPSEYQASISAAVQV